MKYERTTTASRRKARKPTQFIYELRLGPDLRFIPFEVGMRAVKDKRYQEKLRRRNERRLQKQKESHQAVAEGVR